MTVLQLGDPVPLYYQLELLLRDEIETGRLAAGEALPGENLLAAQFNVSRITVRKALDRLEEDGLIIRRRGARTLVSRDSRLQRREHSNPGVFGSFEDELRRLGLPVEVTVLESTQGAVPARIASLLEIPTGETVLRIRRLGSSRGTPLWLELRYFPLDVGQRLLAADPTSGSMPVILQERLGFRVQEVRAQLQAVAATQKQAELLGIEIGFPLFRHQSVTMVSGRKPVQVYLAHLRGDFYRLDLLALPRVGAHGLELVGGGYVVDDSLLDLE